MILSMIAAIDQHNGIGYQNRLLCHLKEDLAFFKQQTLGHPVLMGRNTWYSLGRPLPKRQNIVLSSKGVDALPEEVWLFHSLPEALAACIHEEKAFIIGGAQLYKAAMPSAQELIITQIDHTFQADAFFPAIEPACWQCTTEQVPWLVASNGLRYRHLVYRRNE